MMFKELLFFISICSICVGPLNIYAEQEQAKGSYVAAYYFHGNFRCVNCRNIEQYAREAAEKYFKDELNSGRLIFKTINVDEAENRHFIKDYQLYTKSLVLSLVKDGREVKSKNLTGVWECLGDKQRFYEYVRGEIEDYIGELDA